MKGNRATLVVNRLQDKTGVSGKSPMTLQIDFNGGDLVDILPNLTKTLFFPDRQSAIAALPPGLAQQVPYDVSHQRPVPCDCFRMFDNGQWMEWPNTSGQLKQPRLLKVETPNSAAGQRYSGLVVLSFRVSSTGIVDDVWLALAAGVGPDEAAEFSMRTYRFAPAEYNGHPVGVRLTTEINFQ
jgi:hypothetical protein